MPKPRAIAKAQAQIRLNSPDRLTAHANSVAATKTLLDAVAGAVHLRSRVVSRSSTSCVCRFFRSAPKIPTGTHSHGSSAGDRIDPSRARKTNHREKERIQTSAAKQSVRETCSVPGPADGSDTGARSPAGCARFSVLDFLLAAQSAAATTIP